jgi:hypothetical protein
MHVCPSFFLFLTFFSKDSRKYAPTGKILKMDPQLGAVVISAKITRLSTSAFGAKVLAHIGIDTDVVLT